MARHKHYGDCEYCANDGSHICDECEHNEREYFDYWEEDTPEAIAAREKAEYEAAIKKAITEHIEVNVSDHFRQTFEIAQKCAAREHFRPAFMGVLMTHEGYMVASNTYLICKIKCDDIPERLQGQIVITLEDNHAGICSVTYPNWKEVMKVDGLETIPYSQAEKAYKDKDSEVDNVFDLVIFKLSGASVVLDKAKLQLVEDILQGDLMLSYRKGQALSPLFFDGDNGTMAVVPVRSEDSVSTVA